MPPTTLPGPVRRGKPGCNQKMAATCLISIGRDQNGTPTGLRLFPQRADDTKIIHHAARPGKPAPLLPREMVWVAGNLQADETLRIRPKTRSAGAPVFGWRECEIKYPNSMVSSGPLKPGAWKGATIRWEYEVVLERTNPEGKSHTASTLDPVIIIEPDPTG